MLESNDSRRLARSASRSGAAVLCLALLLAAGSAACVTENLTTGEMVPRGKQKFPFDKVEEAAKRLEDGMTKMQVMGLLGSPAETDDKKDVWIYLPERYAILVPARALRLEFRDDVLVEHGYRPIVLGARL